MGKVQERCTAIGNIAANLDSRESTGLKELENKMCQRFQETGSRMN